MRASLLVLGVLALGACARPTSAPPSSPRGLVAEQDVPPPIREALASRAGETPLALRLTVPGEGAVLPWTFPSGTFQWQDDFQANWFRLRLRRAEGAPLEVLYTKERRVDLSGARWAKVREAVSEGGALVVELTGVSVLPSGRMLRGPARQEARVRFSGAGEHPTGRILYADRRRFVGSGPGPVVAEMRNAVPMALDMDGRSEVVIEALPTWRRRAPSPGDDPGQALAGALATVPERARSHSVDLSTVARRPGEAAWQQIPRRYTDNCLSCHTTSADGRVLAIITIDRESSLPGYSATNGTTVILRRSDQEVLFELPSARGARFHPLSPNLLLYVQVGMETNLMRRTSTSHGDLRVLDLATGEDRPVPGASDPDRVEAPAEWSPDGRRIVFTRSRPGEPVQGRRGRTDLAVVPWAEDAREATAVPLVGASDNGTTNLSPTWSPDGRWIVFVRADEGVFAPLSADLWVVPAQGGEARLLPLSSDAVDSQPAFSPDGRWLVFRSNRDAVDRPRAYVARFFETGTAAPPLPLPGAGDERADLDYVTWVPGDRERLP